MIASFTSMGDDLLCLALIDLHCLELSNSVMVSDVHVLLC